MEQSQIHNSHNGAFVFAAFGVFTIILLHRALFVDLSDMPFIKAFAEAESDYLVLWILTVHVFRMQLGINFLYADTTFQKAICRVPVDAQKNIVARNRAISVLMLTLVGFMPYMLFVASFSLVAWILLSQAILLVIWWANNMRVVCKDTEKIGNFLMGIGDLLFVLFVAFIWSSGPSVFEGVAVSTAFGIMLPILAVEVIFTYRQSLMFTAWDYFLSSVGLVWPMKGTQNVDA